MPIFLKLVGHAADIAAAVSAPMVFLPVLVLLAWPHRWFGEMQQRYKNGLIAIACIGLLGWAIEMGDKLFLSDPPTRTRLHFTAASPTPEMIFSENIYQIPTVLQYDAGGYPTIDPARIKFTIIFVTFEKPITAPRFKISFDAKAVHYEIKKTTDRYVTIVFDGSLADNVVDIERQQQ